MDLSARGGVYNIKSPVMSVQEKHLHVLPQLCSELPWLHTQLPLGAH